MTLKILFKNLYKSEAKRNLWLTGISIFVMFICLPFQLFQKIQGCQSGFGQPFKSQAPSFISYKNSMLNEFLYQDEMLLFALGCLAVLNGIFLFSYLFSKTKQDFYFSQPLKRNTLFWCSYVQGVINVAIPYVFCIIIVAVTLAINNCSMGVIAGILVQTFLGNMLFYLAVYSLIVLGAVLTGTLLFAFLGSAVLGFYFPAYFALFDMIMQGNNQAFDSIMNKIVYLSPVTTFIMLRGSLYDAIMNSGRDLLIMHSYSLKIVCIQCVWLAVTLFAAYKLYQIRGTEAAGKTLAFSKTKGIIKGMLIVYFSLFIAYIMPQLFFSKDLSYRIAGLVIGLILGLYMLDTMIELSWKAFFENWKKQFKYAAICIVFFVALQVYSDKMQYHGFDNIPDCYSIEQAVKDGCVIFDEDKMTQGEDAWNTFVDYTSKGKNGKVRLLNTGYGDRSYTDIVYQDGLYTIYTDYNLYQKSNSFRYLLDLRGNDPNTSEEHRIALITNDKTITYDDFGNYYFGNDNLDVESDYRIIFIE